MHYLLFSLIMLQAFTSTAQEGLTIKVGERGQEYPAVQNPITLTMKAYDMKDDPVLHAHATSYTYDIASYEMAVRPQGEGVAGVYKIDPQGDDEQYDDMQKYMEAGTKVYYDKIIILCKDCPGGPRQMAQPSIVVTLE